MKDKLLFGLGWLLSLACMASAAQFFSSEYPLGSGDTLEIVFDEPMVATEAIGKSVETPWLEFSPPVQSKAMWSSQKSLQVTLQSLPQPGAAYSVNLGSGIKDLSGKEVATEKLGDFRSVPFKIAETQPGYDYVNGRTLLRQPKHLLQFNDEVSLQSLEESLVYLSEKSATPIPVKARYAVEDDLKRFYQPALLPLWNASPDAPPPSLSHGNILKNVVVIESAQPLPEGEGWSLRSKSPIPNLNQTATLTPQKFPNCYWGSIYPLKVVEILAETKFDEPHRITIEFNKGLIAGPSPTEDEFNKIRKHLHLFPEVPHLKIEVNRDELILIGAFELNTPYRVEIQEGLAGYDELPLRNTVFQELTFAPDPAYVSTEANDSRALAKSSKGFDFFAGNFESLKLRVKRLNVSQYLKAQKLHNENYNAHVNRRKNDTSEIEPYASFDQYPGDLVYQIEIKNTKPLQASTTQTIPWKEFLGGVETGLAFFEIEATPMVEAGGGIRSTRGLVNVTDLNLFMKKAGENALSYATSMASANAIVGAEISVLDENGAELSKSSSNDQGLAEFKTPKGAQWITLKSHNDLVIIPIDGESQVSFYHPTIEEAYHTPWKNRLQAFGFTDRPIYKPGDKVFLKAYVRNRFADEFSLPKIDSSIRLEAILNDPNGREISVQPITLDAQGNWDSSIQLPEEQVGFFSIHIRVAHTENNDSEAPVGDESSEEDEDFDESGSIAYIPVRVEEYKVNTFEIKIAETPSSKDDHHYTIPLKANYFIGKALSTAKVDWSWEISDMNVIPEAGWEYHFGRAPRWSRYIPNGTNQAEASEDDDSRYWMESGETALDEHGLVELKLPLPPPNKSALPQKITLVTDITDINQQTISKSQTYTIPGAEFLLGAKIDKWYAQAQRDATISLITLKDDGSLLNRDVEVSYKVERQDWNIVKIQGAGNTIITKNGSHLEVETEGTIQITKGHAQLTFKPQRSGNYFVTVEATDSSGKKLLTRLPFYSLGAGSFPWAWDEDGQLTLQAQPSSLKIGEETTIMVQAPYAAKALVTVERNRIHRYFIQDISPENPIVKIKAEEEDFPNAYVSVYLLRGADQSPHAHPMPDYRIGYVQLNVDSDRSNLNVKVIPSVQELKPKESITLETIVTDLENKPVKDANVTLFAVDEGVLTLVNFITPRASTEFYSIVPLSVANYFTLYNLLNDDAKKRYRGNKGILIGGGGEDSEQLNNALRKNFVATAYWNAKLQTDEEGKAIAQFEVPDSLTRYKVMALVSEGTHRFGTGESSFTINKPLAIEPVVPRFANLGDELIIKALLHLQAPKSGEFKFEVQVDDHAVLVNHMGEEVRKVEQVVSLQPKDSKSWPLKVRFVKRGEAVWRWKVTSLDDSSLSDYVESRFEVTHPVPVLREIHHVELNQTQPSIHIEKLISPQLLAGDHSLQLSYSYSRMLELESSLDFLLQYPYGCVEQTTSRLIPWLNLSKRFEELFPTQLSQSKAKIAIERGVQRLLSMQTYEGGLSYWPGNHQAELWATAYGGFALFKAKDWGVAVPNSSLESLTDYLTQTLRKKEVISSKDSTRLTSVAMALYTLARANKAEESIQNSLYQRRAELNPEGRAFLALAMCITHANSKLILDLIEPKVTEKKPSNPFWLGDHTVDGLKLIIYAHLGQKTKAEATMTHLLKARASYGHWGSTFSNAWILTGFATNSPPNKNFRPVVLQSIAGESVSEIRLEKELSKASQKLNSTDDKKIIPQIELKEGDLARVKIEITSYPLPESVQPVQKGYSIQRAYKRMTPTGALEEVDHFEVGDLVAVELTITSKTSGRYLVIEDPLPSVFEGVNPAIESQKQSKSRSVQNFNHWYSDHQEIRNDRALFFTTYVPDQGSYVLRYLARVMGEGKVNAPPAKIEEMYQPSKYGLGEITPVEAKATQYNKE